MFTPKSVSDAVAKGVSLEIAYGIYNKLNWLVEKGVWIPVHIDKPRFALSNLFSSGTSIMTYWGKKEFIKQFSKDDEEIINYAGENYHQLSRSKTFKLKDKGFIGETHEIILGSAHYPTWICPLCKKRNIYNNNDKLEICKTCGNQIPEKLRLPIEKKRPDTAPLGKRVMHRHWEIEHMWQNLNKNGRVKDFIECRFP